MYPWQYSLPVDCIPVTPGDACHCQRSGLIVSPARWKPVPGEKAAEAACKRSTLQAPVLVPVLVPSNPKPFCKSPDFFPSSPASSHTPHTHSLSSSSPLDLRLCRLVALLRSTAWPDYNTTSPRSASAVLDPQPPAPSPSASTARANAPESPAITPTIYPLVQHSASSATSHCQSSPKAVGPLSSSTAPDLEQKGIFGSLSLVQDIFSSSPLPGCAVPGRPSHPPFPLLFWF
ncbi:hypothetical protein V8C26DRAFT_55253 [Trichoderma gracile]